MRSQMASSKLCSADLTPSRCFQDVRIDFQFSKGSFDFNFLPFTIPYPVPFKALGDETKVGSASFPALARACRRCAWCMASRQRRSLNSAKTPQAQTGGTMHACRSPVRTHEKVVSTQRWPHPLDLALNFIIQTTCRASLM